VLSHDGRVVCPWHGGESALGIVSYGDVADHVACFNVCTGDIEDAPGLDSLWAFSAAERDGKIVVKASEKEVKSKVGRVIPKSRTPKDHTKEKVVIVGGGSGGIHTVESLRMVSPHTGMRVLGRD
jgi:nitrite reductase/ring-hydroxylating ferredoxin subunit